MGVTPSLYGGLCIGSSNLSSMSISAILVSSFLLGLSGALMPGPLFTLTVEKSVVAGLRGGFFATLGHAVTELLLVLVLALGFGTYLSRPATTIVVGILGGAMLLYMGWGMISRARSTQALEVLGSSGGSIGSFSWWKAAVAGGFVSVANPYWLLWWTTVGVTYFYHWGGGTPLAISAFYVGHVAADFAWLMTVSGGITFGHGVIPNQLYKGLLASLGGLLMALACYFIYSGFRLLRG